MYLTSAFLSTEQEGVFEFIYSVEQVMGMLNESPKTTPYLPN